MADRCPKDGNSKLKKGHRYYKPCACGYIVVDDPDRFCLCEVEFTGMSSYKFWRCTSCLQIAKTIYKWVDAPIIAASERRRFSSRSKTSLRRIM